jgi:hypothetical protein
VFGEQSASDGKEQEDGENYIKRSFRIYTLHQILLEK